LKFQLEIVNAYNNSNNSPEIIKCLTTTTPEQPTKPQFIRTTSATSSSNITQNLRDVKISRFTVASQIVIPASASSVMPSSEQQLLLATCNEPIVIQPGQQVYLLTSAKGTFLRTPDKKYVALTDEIYSKLSQSISQNLQQQQQQQTQQEEQPVNLYNTSNGAFGYEQSDGYDASGNMSVIPVPTLAYSYGNGSGGGKLNGDFSYSYGNGDAKGGFSSNGEEFASASRQASNNC